MIIQMVSIPSSCLLRRLGFSTIPIHAKIKFSKKKKSFFLSQGLNPSPHNCNSSARPTQHANIYAFQTIYLLITLQTHHRNIIKLNNTKMAYLGLKHKSSHTIKVLSTN